jgi:hypothetical protein
MRSVRPKYWIAVGSARLPRSSSAWTMPGLALALTITLAAAAHAVPLLPAFAPEAPQTEAAVPAPGSSEGDLRLGGGLKIAQNGLGAPAQTGFELDAASVETALLLDPDVEGQQAIAQSLQESTVIRRVLGGTLAIRGTDPSLLSQDGGGDAAGLGGDDADFSAADSSVPEPASLSAPGGGAAARPAARRLTAPEAVDDVALTEDDGPTLRTVMRSLLSVRRPNRKEKPRTVTQSVATAADDVLAKSFDLSERLLDSRMLGDVLQTIIQPTADGRTNSFSVLGYGRFELDVDQSTSWGNITLSEGTTGLSLSVPLENPTAYGDGAPYRVEQRPPLPAGGDLITATVDFLTSETGIFVMVLAGCLVLVLAAFRVAMTLRR